MTQMPNNDIALVKQIMLIQCVIVVFPDHIAVLHVNNLKKKTVLALGCFEYILRTTP